MSRVLSTEEALQELSRMETLIESLVTQSEQAWRQGQRLLDDAVWQGGFARRARHSWEQALDDLRRAIRTTRRLQQHAQQVNRAIWRAGGEAVVESVLVNFDWQNLERRGFARGGCLVPLWRREKIKIKIGDTEIIIRVPIPRFPIPLPLPLPAPEIIIKPGSIIMRLPNWPPRPRPIPTIAISPLIVGQDVWR